MKKLIYIALTAMLFPLGASAQFGFSWTRKPVVVESPPQTKVVVTEYYYFPNHSVYYNIPSKRWIYLDQGKWVYATVLPTRYNVISLNNTQKVKLDYAGSRPYIYYKSHKAKYPPGQLKKMNNAPDNRSKSPASHPGNHPGNNNGKGKGHQKGK